jgi:hypothetical protein
MSEPAKAVKKNSKLGGKKLEKKTTLTKLVSPTRLYPGGN